MPLKTTADTGRLDTSVDRRVLDCDCRAFRWSVYRDLEEADRYVDTFVVNFMGAEHLRQHERVTNADRAVEDRLRIHVTDAPSVRHLVSPHPHT